MYMKNKPRKAIHRLMAEVTVLTAAALQQSAVSGQINGCQHYNSQRYLDR